MTPPPQPQQQQQLIQNGRELHLALRFAGEDSPYGVSPRTFLREILTRKQIWGNNDDVGFLASLRSSLTGEVGVWYDSAPLFGNENFPERKWTTWQQFERQYREHYGLEGVTFKPQLRTITAVKPRESMKDYFSRIPQELAQWADHVAPRYLIEGDQTLRQPDFRALLEEMLTHIPEGHNGEYRAAMEEAIRRQQEQQRVFISKILMHTAVQDLCLPLAANTRLQEQLHKLIEAENPVQAPRLTTALNIVHRHYRDNYPPSINQMDAAITTQDIHEIHETENPTTAAVKGKTSGTPKKNARKKKKPSIVCSFCQKSGHDVNRCYKKNGYPPWHALHVPAANAVSQTASIDLMNTYNVQGDCHGQSTAPNCQHQYHLNNQW